MSAAAVTVTIAVPTEDLVIAAPLPEFLTQRNVEAVTGIPAHIYLAALRQEGFPLAVRRLGKLRIVDRASFAAWLRAPQPGRGAAAEAAEAGALTPANDAAGNDAAGNALGAPTADAVLAEIGCERTSPPARKAR